MLEIYNFQSADDLVLQYDHVSPCLSYSSLLKKKNFKKPSRVLQNLLTRSLLLKRVACI